MSTKDYLAQTMPQTTKIMALFREVFGPDVKVLWAKENGVEVGKMQPVSGVIIHFDSTLTDTKLRH